MPSSFGCAARYTTHAVGVWIGLRCSVKHTVIRDYVKERCYTHLRPIHTPTACPVHRVILQKTRHASNKVLPHTWLPYITPNGVSSL